MNTVGLIAGGGQFPLLFAARAAQRGFHVVAVAYINEADRSIQDHVAAVEWLHIGQVGRLIKFFRKNGVSQAVMLGSVKKTRIFRDIKPDLKAVTFIASKGITHDDGILRSFADLLEKEGIAVRPSTFLLPELISPLGCWTKREPLRSEYRDIEVGWHMAREIGRLDIGQCVVVANGTVLAVEGADGTDATIERGGALAGRAGEAGFKSGGEAGFKSEGETRGKPGGGAWGKPGGTFGRKSGAVRVRAGAVAVKLAKPGQDLRFDLPASGIETVRTMIGSGVSVLVLEADKTISFDRESMIALADENNISIAAYNDSSFNM
ncbi:MAG: UDP-2,3-diacylglucosamine diphosphatase LpxI [Desulfamplus sp.]|nr:UDP-2,3-diacylglucosamine diphosphatase LpxI [Desulfamplus sp.]